MIRGVRSFDSRVFVRSKLQLCCKTNMRRFVLSYRDTTEFFWKIKTQTLQ